MNDLIERLRASEAEADRLQINVEKRLCEILGRPWAPVGISIATLLDGVEQALSSSQARVKELEMGVREALRLTAGRNGGDTIQVRDHLHKLIGLETETEAYRRTKREDRSTLERKQDERLATD